MSHLKLRILVVLAAMTASAGAAYIGQEASIPTAGRIPDLRLRNPVADEIDEVVRHVQGNVYVVAGAGGHIAVLPGEDGIVMVDAQFAQLSTKVEAAIREISSVPFRILINTHVHPDHIGGNAHFAGLGALVFAHENVRMQMSRGQTPDRGRPAVTYSEPVRLHLNGEEIEIIPAPEPSHTDGDCFIYFRTSNVLAMGDVYTTDYPGIGASGTSQGLIENWNLALDLIDEDTRIIPGHGQISTRTELERLRDAMTAIKERIDGMVSRGMTLEEVKAAAPTRDYDAEFAVEKADQSEIRSTESFIEFMYNEASSRQP